MWRRQEMLLCAAVAVIGANGLMLSPIAGSIAHAFGSSAPEVLTATATYGLATAATAFGLAARADRLGAGRLLAAGLWLLAAALAASALAPSVALLAAAQVLAGGATGAALPAAYALAGHIAAPGHLGRTMGRALTGWVFALVVGVMLSALLADTLGWRAAYGGLAAITALVALASGRGGWPAAQVVAAPGRALAIPGARRALAVGVGFMLAFYGFYSYAGPHVSGPDATGGLGLNATAAGLFSLAYGAGFAIGGRLSGWLDRVGPRQAALPVYAACAAIYAAMAVAAPSYPALQVLAILWGVAQHLGLNLVISRLVALDPARRGALTALNVTATYLCVFGGAVLFRPLFEVWGLAAVALSASGCLLLVVAEARSLRKP